MKKCLSFILALFVLFSLCACGADTSDAAVTQSAKNEVMYAAAPAEGAVMAEASYAMADMAAAEDYGGLSAARGEESAALTANAGENGADMKPDKIIYSADATVETTDFDAAIEKLAQMVDSYGGWVESSSVNGSNYYDQSRGRASTRSAYYCLRIPSERFTELMNALPALGNVPYSYTYTENVSARYYDTEARLNAYTAQEERLIEMLEIAETVEDVIAIEEKLTDLRYQIESLQSSLNNWDRQISYSTVGLSIQEVEKYTPQTVVQPSYGEKLMTAVVNGFEAVGDFFSGLLLWLVEALPSIVLIALLLFVIVKLFKLRRVRKAKKKADRETGIE